MDTVLFNQDPASGFASTIPLGGLPVFTNDLEVIQNNIILFGVGSLLSGYDCILDGCEVDKLNTTTKKFTVLPGRVLIQGIVFAFDGIVDGTYPMQLVVGTLTPKTRAFKDGTNPDVTIHYALGILTSFAGVNEGGDTLKERMPDALARGVYFDPFCGAKSEFILRNRASGLKEQIPIWNSSEILITETGRGYTGPKLNWILPSNEGRWKWLAWQSHSSKGDFVLRNAGNGGNPGAGTQNSSTKNFVQIQKENLPRHQHSEADGFDGSLKATSPISGHKHTWTAGEPAKRQAESFKEGGGNTIIVEGDENNTTDIATSGEHEHNIGGSTGTHDQTWGNSIFAIDVTTHSYYVNFMSFEGYQSIKDFYNFREGDLPTSNM